MAKKKSNRLKTFGKFLLFVVTFLAAIGLLFSFMAKLLPPSFSSTVAYCGLFFPYLLLVNFVLTFIWIVVDFTWAIIPVSVILLNVNNIDRHFQFRGIEKPEVCANCLKVMSYNAKAFNIYRDDQMSLNRQFIHFLQNEKPDILCIQEYSYDNTGKSGFNSTQAIIDALNVKDNEKTHKIMLPYRNKLGYQFGMAVFSKYRIVDGGFVETSDSSSNKSMYVDIRFNGDTLRIYNIHLASMHLDSADYATGKALWAGSYDSTFNNKAQMLSNKISAPTWHGSIRPKRFAPTSTSVPTPSSSAAISTIRPPRSAITRLCTVCAIPSGAAAKAPAPPISAATSRPTASTTSRTTSNTTIFSTPSARIWPSPTITRFTRTFRL